MYNINAENEYKKIKKLQKMKAQQRNTSQISMEKGKDEINEKNKQINLITENHQNDLNELNTSIILLKSKIAKLQEENISLSYRDKNAP